MQEAATMLAEEPPQTLQVGPDRVTIHDYQVVIEAARPMPDWQVREFCRTPIWFQEKKYFLRQKGEAQKPYAVLYILEPWTEACGTTSAGELVYDEETVAARDHQVKVGHMEDVARAFMLLFYPFLGLLWSGTKDKLARFGFVSRTITGVSIMLVFGLVMLDGVFAKLLMMGSLRSGQLAIGGMLRAFAGVDYLGFGFFQVKVLWLDIGLFALLLLDCLLRYGHHLSDSETHWGFCEWMWRTSRSRQPVKSEE